MANVDLIGLRGYLIDAPEFGRLRSWPDGAIVLEEGRIVETGDFEFLRKKYAPQISSWRHYPGCVITPGLIDLHAHLPQYPAVARGEEGLLPWLRRFVFPLEREFTGPKARREAPLFFQKLAGNGTTTAVVTASIFEDSCEAAFEAASATGLRVIMGQVMMDVSAYGNTQPRKILSIALLEAERLCEKWHGAREGLLEYAFSPRFAVSCSEKMLRSVAKLAAKHNAYLQTHLSENKEELEKVRNLFMWSDDYAHIYEACEMLGPRTILAHCLHLSETEIGRIVGSGAGIAHCPTANLYLGSGLLPFERLHQAGIPIGLGTDVAAGPELNLWQAMRSTVEIQKMRAHYESGIHPLKPVDAFHLATQGAARVLGKESVIGSLEPGREADLLVLNLRSLLPYPPASGSAPIPSDLTPTDIISLLVYRGTPHAVVETMVRGQSVFDSPQPFLFAR